MSKKTELLKEEKNKKKRIIRYIVLGLCVLFFIWIVIINLKGDVLNYKTYVHDGVDYYQIEGKKFTIANEKTDLVMIEVKKYGIMIAELYPDIAPITVDNFKNLVSEKFYDNLTFHRVIKDFMIQTGDPTGTGSGGSEKTIKGEFSINGINNTLSHTRGVLSMARRGPNYGEEESSATMDSASSQFFIVHKDSVYLDTKYAAFGKLLYGYDVLDKVASVTTDENDKPIDNQIISSIVFVEEVK